MTSRGRVSGGLGVSKVSPVDDSTHSPSIKFLNTLVGWLLPRVAGEASVSVAMIAPYECLDIDATAGREGAARQVWLWRIVPPIVILRPAPFAGRRACPEQRTVSGPSVLTET